MEQKPESKPSLKLENGELKTFLRHLTADHHANNKRLLSEKQQLCKQLPERVWVLILENLTQAKDIRNCCNASLYFRYLLHSKLQTVIFPSVFDLLLRYVHWYRKISLSTSELVHLLGVLRLVCKTWNEAVDKFFVSEPERHDFTNFAEFKPAPRPQHLKKTYAEWASGRCPFIEPRRSVAIAIAPDLPGEEKFPSFRFFKTEAFLARHGRYIWDLNIHSRFDNWPDFHRTLNLLQFTPNLKSLGIFFNLRSSYWDQVAAEAERQALLNLFPHLENLEFIQVRDIPTPAFAKLLESNSHISTLHINFTRWYAPNNARAEHLLGDLQYGRPFLPYLTRLVLMECKEQDFLELDKPQVNWPLTYLSLELKDDFVENPKLIFQLIEKKWSDTLTELWLSFGKGRSETALKQKIKKFPELQLNRLEHLTLLLNTYQNIDFILPCRHTLQTLQVEYALPIYPPGLRWLKVLRLAKGIKSEKSIKFMREIGPWKSNIWELFPKLEEIRTNRRGWMLLTREEWKQRSIKKGSKLMSKKWKWSKKF